MWNFYWLTKIYEPTDKPYAVTISFIPDPF